MKFNKKRWNYLNSKAKALGGYTTIDIKTKLRTAETYYKNALDKELRAFLFSVIDDTLDNYTTIPKAINNSVYINNSVNDVIKILHKAIKTKLPVFINNAKKVILKWFKNSNDYSKRAFKDAFNKATGINISIHYNKQYDDLLKVFLEKNAGLVQNLANQSINSIQNIIYDGMVNGLRPESLRKNLMNTLDISSKRAKFIARDQSAKLNASLNQIKQKEAGIEFFEWITVEDERVSTGKGGHKQLHGKIYKWGDVSNYPVIDSAGNRGVPSQRPNCRCVARAVILLKDYEAKQLSDGSYKIIKGRI